MKKRLISVIVLTLLGSFFISQSSVALEIPKIESFKFNPDDIELDSEFRTVQIKLVAFHESGIADSSVRATITDSVGNTYITNLLRTDNPINFKLPKVTFEGSINFPKDSSTGIYSITASSIQNNSSAGYQMSTGTITIPNFRNLAGAENTLIVRKSGYLDLTYTTFVGPSWDTNRSISFNDPVKYSPSNSPIWKVGEIIDLINYFENQLKDLPFEISSSTPSVCTTDDTKLKLVSTGACSYKVFTKRTTNYKYFENLQSVNVSPARIKPVIELTPILNQTSEGLPKTISISKVYNAAAGWVLPTSLTQSVCTVSGYTVTILSGGTCSLAYQTVANADYLASDIFKQTFEISRNAQSMTFEVPATAKVGSKGLSLAAVASSAGPLTFAASPTNVCSVVGNKLNFIGKGTCQVTATQAGTTTIAPVSITNSIAVLQASLTKKSITCIKGNKKIKTTTANCPKGYIRK